jgi:drug/metabolite transporter superfamily protein YnfA
VALCEIVSSFVFFRVLLWLKKISRRCPAILRKFIFSHERAQKNTKEHVWKSFHFCFTQSHRVTEETQRDFSLYPYVFVALCEIVSSFVFFRVLLWLKKRIIFAVDLPVFCGGV